MTILFLFLNSFLYKHSYSAATYLQDIELNNGVNKMHSNVGQPYFDQGQIQEKAQMLTGYISLSFRVALLLILWEKLYSFGLGDLFIEEKNVNEKTMFAFQPLKYYNMVQFEN